MGLSQRRKGAEYERRALQLWKEWGVWGRRTSASGAAPGYVADLEIELDGIKHVEVKYSAIDRGAGIMRKYVEGCDILMMKAPNRDWLFCLKEEDFRKLIMAQLAIDRSNLEIAEPCPFECIYELGPSCNQFIEFV